MWRGAALVVVLLACFPRVAAAAPYPPDPGQTKAGTTVSGGTEFRYLLYTPASYTPGRPAPLLVMVHGCQTTAEQEMKVTLYNKLAEREGFVVLYPDVDALGRAQPGPLNQCWQFANPAAYFRGNSDSAAIAEMTRDAMDMRKIDPERVYVVGISAGGLMASVEAAAYSDLYAAYAILESAAYAAGACFTTGVSIPAAASAQLAFAQMGPRARVVPVFALAGSKDLAFPPACVATALEQGLRTNNLVISGSQERPIALTPAVVRERKKPGGYAYTVSTYRDPAGCLVGEHWLVHGLAHAWPGGTTDKKYAGYGDVRAPSGAEATWAFLKRYRKSDTSMPCAEAPIAHRPPSCLPGRLKVSARRIGPVRLRRRLSTLTGRYRVARRTRRSARFCVRGGGRFVVGLRSGRVDLIATNARGHRRRAAGPGSRLRHGRLRGSRRVTRGLRVGNRSRGGRVLYRVRRSRVRFLAVVTKRQVRRPRALTRRLRRLGYR